MPTFLQPVDVPERRFLHEALLWLAFQRLPIALYNDDDQEIRSATEYDGYELESPGGPLTDEECNLVGMPLGRLSVRHRSRITSPPEVGYSK